MCRRGTDAVASELLKVEIRLFIFKFQFLAFSDDTHSARCTASGATLSPVNGQTKAFDEVPSAHKNKIYLR